MVAALTIADLLLLRYPATSSKHSYFYCCLRYSVFTESLPSSALAIHVTILHPFARQMHLRNMKYDSNSQNTTMTYGKSM
jgi:hypothetical protein